MRINAQFRFIGISFVLCTPLLPTPVVAQDELVLEEIVVTAQRRESDLQSTPVSVQAITGDYIANYGIDDIQEIGNRIPGLAFETVDRSTPGLYMRGIGGGSGTGTDGAVSLFVDEVYFAGSDMQFDIFDVERIEVLRGPQGTLFGRNVVGGAIRVITETPDENSRGAVEASLGRWNHKILKGKISGPLSDNVFGLVTAKFQGTDGWAINEVTGNDMGGIDQFSTRAKLRFVSGDSMETRLNFHYMRDKSGGIPFFALPGSTVPALIPDTIVGGSDRITNAFDGSTDRTASGASLHIDWDNDWIGESSFHSITAWHTNDSSSIGPDQAATASPDVYTRIDIAPTDTTFSQEFRLDGQGGRVSNWVTGLYFLTYDRAVTEPFNAQWHPFSEIALLNSMPEAVGLPPFLANILLAPIDSPNQPLGFVSVNNQDISTTSIAGFGQVEFALNDQSNLTVGLRWTEDERQGRAFTTGDYGPFNPWASELYDESFEGSWSAWTPKIIYDYSLENAGNFDSLFVYGSVARGFNSGGFGPANNANSVRAGFDPEYATNYELGFKSRFWNDRGQLNATGYHTNYKDLITGLIGISEAGFPFTTSANAGKASINGIELDTAFLLSDSVTLSLVYSWTDATYDELINETEDGIQDFSGNRIEQTPEHDVNVDLAYHRPVGRGELEFAVNYSYRSEKTFGQDEAAEANTIPLTDYAKVNLDASYSWDQWRVSLWGKNLTNTQELNFQIGGALEAFVFNRIFGLDPMDATYTAGGLAQPRSYGITISRSWGD